jgi:hypothetical protein
VINNMIRLLVGRIKCYKKGHTLEDSVSCPFTGKSYRGCSRCGELVTL